MRVAILHYHLRAGGVTRVIELACVALAKNGWEVLVISGEPAPTGCRIAAEQIAVVPELRYGVAAREQGTLRKEVEAAMQRHWGATADLIHLHNHALGKNFALPPVVAEWAEEGRALLLQMHDFAENGRPANYRALREQLGELRLYPMAPHVTYAVLNTADLSRLQLAGLSSPARLLMNPVTLAGEGERIAPGVFEAERLNVYPVRGIRRKNIGEALWWAAHAAPGEKIVLSLAPETGPDVARYARWRKFAEELSLPVVFDAQRVLGRPAEDFLRSADCCLTTSVAEGFGMAFLEPWLAGSTVAGRNLPDVVGNFRAAGVIFDALYDRLDVPVDAVGIDTIKAAVAEQVKSVCADYQVPCEEDFIRQACGAVLRDGQADFGRLKEEHQEKIIRAAVVARERRALPQGTDCRMANRAVVEREFSLDGYGERLAALYKEGLAAKSGPVDFLPAGPFLQQNLSFADFFSLRG